MNDTLRARKRLHLDVTNVGLRPQAIALGFVQLCRELQKEGVLDACAVARIKAAIADDLSISPPRKLTCHQHRDDVLFKLDQLF